MGPCCACPLLLRDLCGFLLPGQNPSDPEPGAVRGGAQACGQRPLGPGTVATSVCPFPWAAQAGS